jgi:tRNA threonylcarbamoyladenosine biosynthesis protein TsaB
MLQNMVPCSVCGISIFNMLDTTNIKILSIESSTEICSVAACVKNQVFLKEQHAVNKHTKMILPMINNILQEAEISIQELDAVAFGKGPGSFTGLRVAAAVTEGISFGLGIKVLGISTLHALAMAISVMHTKHDIILATLDARMGEIYWALFLKATDGMLHVIIPEQVSKFTEIINQVSVYCAQNSCQLTDIISAGTGVHAYKQDFASTGVNISDLLYPSARYIGEIAIQDLQSVLPKYILGIAAPVYIRDNIASK